MTTDLINLQNFFKYYDPENSQHRDAIDQLATEIPPQLLTNEADWVQIYRTPVSSSSRDLVNLSNELPQPGVALIKEFEGCKLQAYPDPKTGGKPITIGWGCTRKRDGSEWKLGDTITQQEADELLALQLKNDYFPPLTKIPYWNDLNENQRGALLSFGYNLGAHFYGAKNFETITRVLRDRSYGEIRKALLLYCNPRDKNVTAGLKRRRNAEADLWEKGIAADESVVPSNAKILTTFKESPSIEVAQNLTPEMINWRDMNFRLTQNFTLGENLKNDSRRIPTKLSVQTNLLKIMKELQKIRDDYGSPIIITSGYRPEPINRSVGGVPDSRHISGDAVDIRPQQGDIGKFQKWVDDNWYGALGWGAKKGFVHIDCRNGKGWKTGGEKGVRWPY